MSKYPFKRAFLLIMALVLLQAGCQTVSRRGLKELAILSDPTGADVLIDGKLAGRTPFVLKHINPKKSYWLELFLPSYKHFGGEIASLANREDPYVKIAFIKKGKDYELDPNPLLVVLRSGDDSKPDNMLAFTEMTFEADKLLRDKKISKRHNIRIQEGIVEYFENKL